jgi:hypothetical protein
MYLLFRYCWFCWWKSTRLFSCKCCSPQPSMSLIWTYASWHVLYLLCSSLDLSFSMSCFWVHIYSVSSPITHPFWRSGYKRETDACINLSWIKFIISEYLGSVLIQSYNKSTTEINFQVQMEHNWERFGVGEKNLVLHFSLCCFCSLHQYIASLHALSLWSMDFSSETFHLTGPMDSSK